MVNHTLGVVRREASAMILIPTSPVGVLDSIEFGHLLSLSFWRDSNAIMMAMMQVDGVV
jgi:hypothetical protein